MKKTIQILLTLATFGATALVAQAQPAPKILVVDMAKLYDGHYKTEEQNAKLRDDEKKAQEEIERRRKLWKQPALKVSSGVLYKYANTVASAAYGCVTDELPEDLKKL